MQLNLQADQPIGIFDSGIGGLTVANAVISQLPNEKIIYFGDTAHLPYGDKSAEAIRNYSEKIADFLLARNCKLIVIACNTASAAAYDSLKIHLADRALLLNVIDPVVEHVAAEKDLHKIGIIGTKGTINSRVYETKLHARRPEIETVALATALLASMIEAGFYNNNVSQAIINSYLSYPDFQDIEGLILACTHYPLIKKEVEFFYHNRIRVFDSTDIMAASVKKILGENNLLNKDHPTQPEFFVSDFTPSFEQTTKVFFGGKTIHLEQYPLWEK